MLNNPQDLFAIIRSWAASSPAIRRAWIFGGYAKGSVSPTSDLDIAIELDEEEVRNEAPYSYWHHEKHALTESLKSIIDIPVDLQLYLPGTTNSVVSFVHEYGVLVFQKRRANQ